MNFPLQQFIAVSAAIPWTYVVFGLIGFALGFTLEMSGFGDSRKLAAQFYFTEMTVLKVMFTVIAVAMVLLFGAVGLGLLNFNLVWVNPTYIASGVLGGLIMGVGFIIGGSKGGFSDKTYLLPSSLALRTTSFQKCCFLYYCAETARMKFFSCAKSCTLYPLLKEPCQAKKCLLQSLRL